MILKTFSYNKLIKIVKNHEIENAKLNVLTIKKSESQVENSITLSKNCKKILIKSIWD